jgi:thiamine-phosphate pyrophosphorylase
MRTARTLGRKARLEKPLPPLLLLTDPGRTPDPLAAAARLPRGAGVVYRAFGDPDALRLACALGRLARRRGLLFLVGADEGLAAASGAHGLHLPERMLGRAPRLRARRPGWVITAAAHSPLALACAARAGCDAALLSAVFPSASPSAGAPLGPVRFAAMSRAARLPVYALGGVASGTAKRLLGSRAVGVAGIGGLSG